VKIKDRVVLSGQFSADDTTLNPALVNELNNLNVALAQFFANAVNTTNKGIDVVIDYHKKIGQNNYKLLFAGNFQDMTIDQINIPAKLNDTKDHQQNFLSDREKAFILASAPKNKFGLNFEFGHGSSTIGTRLTYFGKVDLLGYGEDGLGIDPKVPTDANANILVPDRYEYKGKLITDIYVAFGLSKNMKLFFGADNLFNVHPTLGVVQAAKGWAYNNETGGPWDSVQMGPNGARLFTRLAVTF
jgi:iron complex outermembrane receptor protein